MTSTPSEFEAQDSPEPEAQGPTGPVRWHGLVKVLGFIRKGIDKLLAALCIIFFVLLVAIVTWQVFTREVIGNSAPWTQEGALFTFVVLAMLSAAYVFSERGHIAVEMLVEKLPRPGQKVAGVLIELIVIFFFAVVFIYGGLKVSENAWGQDIASLPISVGQLYLVMPIAGVLSIFYCLSHIIGILSGAVSPVREAEIEEAI